ncbi:MAG TPA: LuxR family transcriptional regulator, partial [Ktedonobacteraceae bacterium]|nr:LuxR family transcriptional regulator [Ktedonobacteraceae bacterium]
MAHGSPAPGVVEENCLIYQQDGHPVRVELDTPAWQDWLENATSFSFKSAEGNFTAHKTRASNGRGGWYWYAHRRLHGQLSNLYLGTSARLTLQRLREAASVLALANDRQTADETFAAPELSPENETLLLSKLRVPRLSPQHVERPRLLSLLDQGILGALTLVAAPAGSGKTTLLAEWAARTDHPLAWISLETADNDPARFLSYLVAALTSLDERIESVQAGHAQSPERALTGLLNELTRLLEQEAVLVLDDYHVLTTPALHALLGFVLDHLPTRLHLIIGTRVDPPLALARLRARSQLSELRAQDLRFVPAEVEALASTMGLALSNEATDLLEERSEGWIAGVQLLALALRGQNNATAFLRAFHGTHRFLLDYVGEEVLAQQTPATQEFLLRTSVLERLTGPLCEAVTGQPDGQRQLAGLLRANLFVSALDEAETWYRYHALFAETLRGHLQKQQPGLLPELYRRASQWYEEQQGLEEACAYALLAGDFPNAARLVGDLLPSMIERGHFEQLGRWLRQLPPELIASSP